MRLEELQNGNERFRAIPGSTAEMPLIDKWCSFSGNFSQPAKTGTPCATVHVQMMTKDSSS
jgi:hypothetical protein